MHGEEVVGAWKYLGDAGIALDDAEQTGVGDAGAPEEVERAEPPARPVRQREERLVRDPVAERRLHGEAAPQERVPATASRRPRHARAHASSSRSRMWPSARSRAACGSPEPEEEEAPAAGGAGGGAQAVAVVGSI